jgi:hypothetical protein
MARTRHRLFWALGSILALALIAPPAWVVWRFATHVAPFRGEDFDPGRWHEAWTCAPGQTEADCTRQRSDCRRGPMVESLVTHWLQRARSDRNATRDLLGEPDSTGPLQVTGNLGLDDCDFYPLGQCSGLRSRPDALYVCFSPDAMIDRAGHIRQ